MPGWTRWHLQTLDAGLLTQADSHGAPLRTLQQLPLLEVKQRSEKSQVPQVGSVVTTKVTSVNQRFAKVEILCVGDTPLQSSFRGLIRYACTAAKLHQLRCQRGCILPGPV